jgi:hypothetical protein
MNRITSFIRHFMVARERGKSFKEAVKLGLHFTKLSKGKW